MRHWTKLIPLPVLGSRSV